MYYAFNIYLKMILSVHLCLRLIYLDSVNSIIEKRSSRKRQDDKLYTVCPHKEKCRTCGCASLNRIMEATQWLIDIYTQGYTLTTYMSPSLSLDWSFSRFTLAFCFLAAFKTMTWQYLLRPSSIQSSDNEQKK